MRTADAEERVRIFLCHARRDLESVVWLRPRLLAEGIEVLGEPGDTLGAEARRERNAAIARVDALLFVLSPFSVICEACHGDLDEARALAKPIIPLVVAEADWSKVPAGMFASQAVMLNDAATREAALGDGLARLARNLPRLRSHATLGARAEDWAARGRPNVLTLAPGEIATAEQWLTEQPEDLPSPSPLLRAFVLANLKVVKQRMRTVAGLSVAAAVTAIAVAGVAIWLHGIARQSERIALERDRAVREQQLRVARLESRAVAALADAQRRRGEADAAHDRAVAAHAAMLMWRADHMRRAGDATQAALVALEVLARAHLIRDGASRLAEAEAFLRTSLSEMRERGVVGIGAASHIAFSPDGALLAVAGQDRIDILDGSSGAMLRRLEPAGLVRSMAFAPDSEQLLTGGDDQIARLWDARTGAAIAESERHPRTIHDVHFSRDGTRYLTASADGRVRVFDTRRSALLFTLAESEQPARSAGFMPEGRHVIVRQNGVRIWDLGSRRTTDLKELGGVDLVALSPDGRHLLAIGEEAVIYDLRIRRKVGILRGLAGVSSAAFSADGRRIATSSADGIIRIWATLSGESLATLRGDAVHALGFAPDGRVLVSAEPGQLRLWDASPEAGRPVIGTDRPAESGDRSAELSGERLLASGRRAVPRCLTLEQRKDLMVDPEPPGWCIELEKWPFAGARWKSDLAERPAGRTAPAPTTR